MTSGQELCQEMLLALVGLVPAPGVGTGTTFENAFTVHVRYYIRITSQKRLGRAHCSAKRWFTFGNSVLAIKLAFLFAECFLRAASTIGAFVHCSTGAEYSCGGELWCSKGAGHKAIAAAYTCFLVNKNNTIFTLVNGINRTDCNAGCISAMHAGYRNRFLAWFSLVDCYYFTAIDPHRNMVTLLTGNNAARAVNTAFNIT